MIRYVVSVDAVAEVGVPLAEGKSGEYPGAHPYYYIRYVVKYTAAIGKTSQIAT